MTTRSLTGDYEIARAADVLRHGGVVVHATEGVWGLACDPDNGDAVGRLLAVKRRSWKEGLVLVAHSPGVFAALLQPLDVTRRRLVADSWPGPVTWLVPHHDLVPSWVHGDSEKVALRVTAHPQFASLCARFGGALASTSANRSGRPPIAEATAARIALGPGVDFVLRGELGGADGPSTMVDVLTLDVLRGSANAVPGLPDVHATGTKH